MKKLIAITGGHHNSALVVARELYKQGYDVIWLGHRYASLKDSNDSAEYIEVTSSGFTFYDLKAGKFGTSPTIGSVSRIPYGIIQARKILKENNVDLLFSFGSYLGLTSAIAAKTLRIPVFLHEQTSVAGKANLLAAKFASKIFLTWESSLDYFPAQKTELVGLPLRETIIKPKSSKLFANSQKTILVIGGKQGSHIINNIILDDIKILLNKYNIILQTGTSSHTNDFTKATNIKESLPADLSSKFSVRGYITEDEIGNIIASSDLLISRSGAHITYELALLKKRAILIPYPHTHNKEQYKNATLLSSLGQAIVIHESTLNIDNLMSAIKEVMKQDKFKSPKIQKDATQKIINSIIDFLA